MSTVTINGIVHQLTPITRGQIRSLVGCTNLENEAKIMQWSLPNVTNEQLDDLAHAEYVTLVDDIMTFNRLGDDAIKQAKKN